MEAMKALEKEQEEYWAVLYTDPTNKQPGIVSICKTEEAALSLKHWTHTYRIVKCKIYDKTE